MAEYLRALKPTLTQQQNDRVTAIVKQFISPSGLGPTLHQYLAEKRDAEDNWVNPCALFSSFVVVFDFVLIIQSFV